MEAEFRVIFGSYSLVVQHPEQVNTKFTPFILVTVRPSNSLVDRRTSNLSPSSSIGGNFREHFIPQNDLEESCVRA
jgi:hypothetical protein